MDKEADQRIQKAALRAAFGVSSCPHPALDAVVVMVLSVLLIRDLMAVYGLRHSMRSLVRVLTRSLFLASTTAIMSTAVEFAMRAAQDRLAAAVVGTAGEALIVAPPHAGAGHHRQGRDPARCRQNEGQAGHG